MFLFSLIFYFSFLSFFPLFIYLLFLFISSFNNFNKKNNEFTLGSIKKLFSLVTKAVNNVWNLRHN